MSWSLRRALPADLEAIMAIETAMFVSDAWSPAMMAAEIEGAHGYYLVAQAEDGGVDGYAGLQAPQGSGQADIQTIAVVERARRRGLGRTLMLALLNEARRRGATEVFLEVRADNPGAQALYVSLGFAEIAVRPNYYQPDGVDALIMRLVVPDPQVSLA
ncbi:ribosomal protein S18-alanine N-acetyltransferase [Pseudolysinimonas sp.]|uniref:ribosomal protein S18-alanine N-acetyltransferase n=1 Tax=Pseudolysinimonas sp. TaxID=2680009 RepID=UPI00286C2007|nr:ribosomal protein S18-alanine N-acetyltransferase [Pseudolysinimonas sp.]